MPIIRIEFINNRIASPEQKRELLAKMTETFVGVLGEATRPFVYCLIQETPPGDGAIAGAPMPDPSFLTGETYARMSKTALDIMRAAITPPVPADTGE
ncbi:tautomerase family protein [Pyxidicoccus caerfyrddinensis]|uniref:tautomerase family protein n=1 Tax=Pyxidicoccus caerfyrddinensis TaxID=2709663 RepID=UPI0013D9C2D3|nr:tautomerase family protein [Pyxidicoccus caerfyrddinensis]